MTSLQVVIISFALLLGCAHGWWRRNQLPEGAQLGDTCEPSHSLLRSTCGEKILLGSEETNETGTERVTGPNVCRVTRMYMQQTVGYTYQQHCKRRGRRCFTGCFATDECNGTMINFTRTSIDCCEGFAEGPEESRETAELSWFSFFRKGHRSSLLTNGCPMELRDTVLDCLAELNLLEFLVLVQSTGLSSRLEDPMSDPVTVFALTDDVIANLDNDILDELFSDIAVESTLSAHIGDKRLVSRKFFNGRFIETLATNVTLHIGRTGNRTTKQFFVNGARISQADACQARNGVVHIVDELFPFSSATINDIFTSDPARFSTYQQLAEAAGIAEVLDVPDKSRTVFAPVNDAFDEPLVQCLMDQRDECRSLLHQFVLIHVAYPAEYTSTLAERSSVPTFTFFHLAINGTEDAITVTRDNIPIDDSDIPARNGVIHAIPEVILPVSQEELEMICPNLTTDPSTSPSTVVVNPGATTDPDGIPPGSGDPGDPIEVIEGAE